MFDSTMFDFKDEQLIEIRYSIKNGKPDDNGRQMYKHHIEFVYDGQRYDHDVYDFVERKPGFYLPAFRPRTLYIQETDFTTKEKYIKRKPVCILQIGAFIHD